MCVAEFELDGVAVREALSDDDNKIEKNNTTSKARGIEPRIMYSFNIQVPEALLCE